MYQEFVPALRSDQPNSRRVARDYEAMLAFSSFSTALTEFPTLLTAALSCSGETPNF